MTEFGGFFKEVICVSCLGRPSYILAIQVMKDRASSGHKVNRTCFECLPGVKDKDTIFKVLQRWSLGQFDQKIANKLWKEIKVDIFIMISII